MDESGNAARFPDDVLEHLASAREVDIETIGRSSGAPRRVTVWVVVDDGVPYLRSEFGEAGQWYRNALADPHLALFVDGHRLAAIGSLVTDPAAQHRVSDALRAKYRSSSAVAEMVGADVEPTTLALAPAP